MEAVEATTQIMLVAVAGLGQLAPLHSSNSAIARTSHRRSLSNNNNSSSSSNSLKSHEAALVVTATVSNKKTVPAT